MNIKIWYAATAIWALLFIGSVTYSLPEPHWEQEKLVEDVDQRFIELEEAGPWLNLIYRNSDGTNVTLKRKKSEAKTFDSLNNILQGNSWETEVIDQNPGVGSYLSAEEVNGKLLVAYQDDSIGSERVVLAKRNSSGWGTETIEGVADGGVNVGMYTSLTSYRGSPVVLYHTPTQGLKAAIKDGDSWNKENLGSSQGWFTASTSCGDEAYVIYRGRNSTDLKMSSYGGTWSTQDLDSSVKSSTDIAERDCKPHIVYLSSDEELRYRSPAGDEEVITDSDYSGASIYIRDTVHASYYDYGEGTFYAEKNGENWEKKKLANHTDSEKYNDLVVDEIGNIHLVYTNDSDIIYAEKSTGRTNNLESLLNYTRTSFGVILLVLLTQILRFRKSDILDLLQDTWRN